MTEKVTITVEIDKEVADQIKPSFFNHAWYAQRGLTPETVTLSDLVNDLLDFAVHY